MININVTESVPLNNGKETIATAASALNNTVLLSDGSSATLKEIVENKETYDGQTITIESKDKTDRKFLDVIVNGENIYLSNTDTNFHLNPKFDLGTFDLTKNPQALKKAITKTSHPMKSKLVAMTELSVVYGPSSSGKTLVTLSDIRSSIQDGIIKGEDVVYVNLDDSAIGLAEKAEILAALNIKMIIKFDLGMLYRMIEENVAKNKVIIIDTVKKIANLMYKDHVADLMKHLKSFTHAGGTVILIAHANKNLGPDGIPVLEGVGDLKNDADCVVRVQRHKDIVTMTNEKNRSYVELDAIFQTADTKDYKTLFHSIEQLSGQEAKDLKLQREQECFKENSHKLIENISEMIGTTPVKKTQLVRDLIEDTGLTRKEIVTILELLEGDLWDVEKGPSNSKNYSLRSNSEPDDVEDDDYNIKQYLVQEGYIPREEDLYLITSN